MGSHWSIIWEELRIDRPLGTGNGTKSAKVSGKKPNISSGLAVKRSTHLPSQLGRIISAVYHNRIFETYKMTKPQLEVLEPEDRFLSIAIPRSDTHPTRREREGTRMETVLDVQQYAGNGFVGAIWYSRSELVNPAQPSTTYHTKKLNGHSTREHSADQSSTARRTKTLFLLDFTRLPRRHGRRPHRRTQPSFRRNCLFVILYL